MSRITLGALVAVVSIALAACGNSKNPDSPERTARVEAVDASLLPPPSSAEAHVDVGLPPEPANTSIDTVAYAGDGTLVLAGGKTLVTRAKDGTTKRIAISPQATVHVSPEFPGV